MGDCDGNQSVSVGEVVRSVGIYLHSESPDDTCPFGDANCNGAIEVSELVRAVNNVLRGCY